MPGRIATVEPSHRRQTPRAIGLLMLLAASATGPSVQAQSSPVREFAIATIAATQVEFGSAKRSYRDCARDGRHSCKVELGRVQDLQHRLKLARDYLDRYCMR